MFKKSVMISCRFVYKIFCTAEYAAAYRTAEQLWGRATGEATDNVIIMQNIISSFIRDIDIAFQGFMCNLCMIIVHPDDYWMS